MKNISLLVFAWLLVLGGCREAYLPGITETPSEDYRNGEVVWRDLITVNPKESAQFYSDLFGWNIQKSDDATPDYYRIYNRGKLIGGIFDYPDSKDVEGNEWLPYVSVGDVGEASKNIKLNGGDIMLESVAINGRGDIAVAVDPSGGVIGLIHSLQGDPVASDPNFNDWLWTELWSEDPGSVQNFCKSLGYSIEKLDDDGRDYWVLNIRDTPVAAVIQNPMDESRSTWLPYIRVEDPASMQEKARGLGATVVLETNAEVRDGDVAILIDPFGAPFAIQRWEE